MTCIPSPRLRVMLYLIFSVAFVPGPFGGSVYSVAFTFFAVHPLHEDCTIAIEA